MAYFQPLESFEAPRGFLVVEAADPAPLLSLGNWYNQEPPQSPWHGGH